MIGPGNFRPTKKLPAPFKRPSITIGGGVQKKREWKWIPAEKLDEGDVIVDLGIVHKIEYENIDDPKNLRILVTVGEQEMPIKFEAGVMLRAFS